jgi:hypothetical protein
MSLCSLVMVVLAAHSLRRGFPPVEMLQLKELMRDTFMKALKRRVYRW